MAARADRADETIPVDEPRLQDLVDAPLGAAARVELGRRMAAGEDLYVYQSGGPSGLWNVWVTDDPGRVQLPIWEAIVAYWQARAEGLREGSAEVAVARYGLQGPPAQREAATRLGEVAERFGDYRGHAGRIVRYAYHEADAYLDYLDAHSHPTRT